MDSSLYARLSPFIQLPDKHETQVLRYLWILQKGTGIKFDLNIADTTQLKSIYGIGSKLSARIVKYRNRLGALYTLTSFGKYMDLIRLLFMNY